MINETILSKELIDGFQVRKCTLDGIDEIQHLHVPPKTTIKLHGHEGKQWEIWIILSPIPKAYVCLKGEEHELVNNSNSDVVIMAIKGHLDYSYDELGELLYTIGFSVHHGSLVITDNPNV